MITHMDQRFTAIPSSALMGRLRADTLDDVVELCRQFRPSEHFYIVQIIGVVTPAEPEVRLIKDD